MINLICLVAGHKLEFSRYSNAMESRAPSTFVRNWDGTHFINPSFNIGFMHTGLVSDCCRCGKVVDTDEMNLPIIEPNFD